jgi:hypothetical protein
MSLIGLILVLVVVGFLMWATTLIPMDANIRRILNVAVVIVVLIWLISALGLLGPASAIRIPIAR